MKNKDFTFHFFSEGAMAKTTLPLEIGQALAKNKTAQAKFNALSPAHQREYVNYVVDAKKPETRTRRALKMLELLLEKK